MNRWVCAVALILCSVSGGAAEIVPSAQIRIRWEGFDTPSGLESQDSTYNFSSLRVRLGLTSKWKHWTLFGELQGAAMGMLPSNGAFAIGPVYAAANPGENSPSQIGLSELSATLHFGDSRIQAGRQKWSDGLETMTGVERLDGIKRRRLSERLIGNWDWVNVGRRFDGLTAGTSLGPVHLSGFALLPLSGGVEYEGFQRLEGLEIYGATGTIRYDTWLPKSELRLYVIRYDDDRPGAITAAGGKIALDTYGFSLLAGGESLDLMIWTAFQRGDFGSSGAEGLAFVVEGGKSITPHKRSFTIRGGTAYGSGDRGENGHRETFFNLLPTNHKYYGSMDYTALSNLRDVYAEVLTKLGGWNLRVGAHGFFLAERTDAWYGGSGAFDSSRLGYSARRPSSGVFAHEHLGYELDLSFQSRFHRTLAFEAGFSRFWGGAAAAEVLPVETNGSWAYAELVWTR